MRSKKFFTRGFLRTLASVLAAASVISSAAAPVSALSRLGEHRGLMLESRITIGSELSPEDAAMRLYYLGFLNGSGSNVNGGIDFSLERGLNRVEAAVFAVRLFGAEEEAQREQYAHPFTDVPEWASDYVGYIYSCGLIDDIVNDAEDPDNIKFGSQLGETAERFMGYMLYALGYRMEKRDYTYKMAAEYARNIGICTVDKDELLTRADAVSAMYNTLRTTVKNSTRVYSDALVEKGAISYSDAIFLIWNRNADEIKTYLSAVGYDSSLTVANGYYKIEATDGGKLMNVAADGMNSDYEGVPVTLWTGSDDITQTFRVERTERGTYYIYAASSRNGYGRVVGSRLNSRTDGSDIGLYGSTGSNAVEWNIIGAADGTWKIVSEDGYYLACDNTSKNGTSVTMTKDSDKALSWKFTREGVLNSSGEELAIFIAKSLYITQGAYDDYSHEKQNAIDIKTTEQAVYAPFNAKVVRIDASEYACNAVWIESISKVRYADGSYDYMTMCLLHDNDISDIYLGQIIKQGEYFYDSGDYGVSSGIHVHFAVYRGSYNGTMRIGGGDINAEDALFLPDDTYVYDDYGLEWTVASLAD